AYKRQISRNLVVKKTQAVAFYHEDRVGAGPDRASVFWQRPDVFFRKIYSHPPDLRHHGEADVLARHRGILGVVGGVLEDDLSSGRNPTGTACILAGLFR